MGGNSIHAKGKTLPVESSTQEDCREFVGRLAERAPGKTFRLPTEAEWEHACRGREINRHANHSTSACRGRSGPKIAYKSLGVRIVVDVL